MKQRAGRRNYVERALAGGGRACNLEQGPSAGMIVDRNAGSLLRGKPIDRDDVRMGRAGKRPALVQREGACACVRWRSAVHAKSIAGLL